MSYFHYGPSKNWKKNPFISFKMQNIKNKKNRINNDNNSSSNSHNKIDRNIGKATLLIELY